MRATVIEFKGKVHALREALSVLVGWPMTWEPLAEHGGWCDNAVQVLSLEKDESEIHIAKPNFDHIDEECNATPTS